MSIQELVNHMAAGRGHDDWAMSARSQRHVTFLELSEAAAAVSALLESRGITSGDRVGLLIADPLDFAVGFVALLSAGLWVAPLDPTVLRSDTAPLAERASMLGLCSIVGREEPSSDRDGQWTFTTPARPNDRGSEVAGGASHRGAGGVILATSGTTGTPKVMLLPIAQLLHTADLVARHNELAASDRGFNPLPLWHINGEVVGVLATLVAGASLVLDDHFHRTEFWSLIDRFEVTWINAVPAIISRLVQLHSDESVPTRVRFIRSASAPLPAVVLQAFEANTGVAVVESYGMTEAASQICANPLRGPRKVGSVGPAIGVEVRIGHSTDDVVDGTSLAKGVGPVEIRGPSVIGRYEGTGYEDRFDADAWLSTGDLGYLDDDGYLFLVGRSDDVINRGGEKIFPREIEDVILGVNGVSAAAVIGLPDEVFGQVPVAYVELLGVSESPAAGHVEMVVGEIRAALVAAFARARRPVTISVVAQLPRHSTGKIQKKLLEAGSVPVIVCEKLS
jgi:acyl-CoA synthetase (AMP-forming)/AMP-acid ligase II